jgi:hypothetical protein
VHAPREPESALEPAGVAGAAACERWRRATRTERPGEHTSTATVHCADICMGTGAAIDCAITFKLDDELDLSCRTGGPRMVGEEVEAGGFH